MRCGIRVQRHASSFTRLRMFTRRTAILVLASAITLIVAALSHWQYLPLAHAELGARDFLARHGRRTEANPKLIFLAIDNASINLDAENDLRDLFQVGDDASPEGRALKLMSQSWPWPRSVYGLILDRLIGAGAKVVAFDLTFPTPSEHDAEFRAALERHAGNVLIGSNFIDAATADHAAMNVSLTRPTPALIPPTAASDPRVGFVNFWPDFDGVVRSAQFRTSLSQIIGGSPDPSEVPSMSLAARAIASGGTPDLIPADFESHTIRFTAPPAEGFKPRSIFEIFVPEYWVRNYGSGAAFRDAIVIVGAAGNWQHDEHQTPFGLMSGPELQLNVVNALRHQEFLKPAGSLGLWLTWVAAGLVAAGCAISGKSPVLRVAVMLAVLVGWIGIQFFAFNRPGLLIPLVGPALIVVLTGLISFLVDLVRAGAEQLRLRKNIAERKRIQESLEFAKENLEKCVQERTAELTEANTKLAALLHEKEILLKEVHHRVKNNLQVISSLLNLQSEYIKDAESVEIFAETRHRVRSMALIHEKLYQSHDLARIDFADYLRSLTRNLQSSYAGRASGVELSVAVDDVMLGVDLAVPCGLIVNELVTNCFKYAFPAGRSGVIQIAMTRGEGSSLKLSVADDGVGFPKHVDFRNTNSLGMQIINTLAEQLDGSIHMSNGVGTKFEISFAETI